MLVVARARSVMGARCHGRVTAAMTWEVIDTVRPGADPAVVRPTHDLEVTMTATPTHGRTHRPVGTDTRGHTHAPVGAGPEATMRRVLLADAVVTAAFGALALLAPTSWFDAAWVPRAVGAVLLVVAVEVGLASRWSGRRLLLAGTVTGELAAAWVVGALAVVALVDLPTTGAVLLEVSAAATVVFAVLELRLARRIRAADSRR